MITAGYVWDEIASILRKFGNDDMESIKHSCQLSYYDIWGMHPWAAGRRKISVTLSATAGVLMPADMVNIEAVYDSANHNEYIPGVQWGCSTRRTWFFDESVQDALALLTRLSVTSKTGTWTGGTWSAAYIGEYIRFGKEPGVHKITAENTFAPRYYGPDLSAVTGIIRPAGTRRLAATDTTGTRDGSAVDVHYWAYPSPLYDEAQGIMLPASKPLELATIIRMMGSKDKREFAADRYRNEFREALDQAKAMNPRFTQSAPATNAAGYRAFNMEH